MSIPLVAVSGASRATIFILLRAERGRFRDGGMNVGLDSPMLQAALRSRLERLCDRVVREVEIKGRLYTTSLFVSSTDPNVAYAETDHDGVPVDASRTPVRPPETDHYTHQVAARCRVSDALTPDTQIPLDAAFVAPRFEVLGSKSKKELSWERLADHSRFVLLGEPGAGKTSCLRRLAVEAAMGRSRSADTVPIYIRLCDFSVDNLTVGGLTRLLRADRAPNPEAEFREPLQAGRLLLLIDGLDELQTDEDRQTLLNNVKELCVRAPRVRIALTSRDSTYDGKLEDFLHIRIKPFDDARIAQWAFQYLGMRKSTEQWRKFLDMLSDDIDLLNLVRNPLLLALITSLYRLYPQDANDRAVLPRKCVDVLIHDWDAARGISRWSRSAVTPRQIVSLLAHLSTLLIAERRDEFTIEEVRQLMLDHVGFRESAITLLSACRTTGLVMHTDAQRWRFTHRYLEDYLAASHLVRRTDDLDNSFETFFTGRLDRKVWAMSCALASDAGDLLRGALNEDRTTRPVAAIMLAEALGQQVLASRKDIVLCCQLIVRTLETLTQETMSAEEDSVDAHAIKIEDRTIVWVGGIAAKISSAEDLDRAGELLRILHLARFGTVGELLFDSMHASKLGVIRNAAHMLKLEGRCHAITVRRDDNAFLWMTVTRAADADSHTAAAS